MTDDELEAMLAALPRYGPAAGFDDRVMARVATVSPHRSTVRSLLFVLVGALAASMAWAWHYQAALATIGQRSIMQASSWLWETAQTLTAMVVQQPEFAVVSKLMANPLQVVLLLVCGSLLYLGGVLTLHWLLTTSTSQVVYDPQ